jgi:hypothetical protein
MQKDTSIIRLRQPDAVDDPLSELAREGARRMLAQALIAEADAFVALRKELRFFADRAAKKWPLRGSLKYAGVLLAYPP